MPKVSVKADFLEARQRIQAWWAGSSLGDRPAVICRVPKRLDKAGKPVPPAPTDPRPREVHEMDGQFHLRQAEWMLDNHHFPAETMPACCPQYANHLCVSAVLAGGELEFRPDTTWIKEMPDVYRRDLPDFDRGHPVFRMLDGALKLLGEELGNRGLVSSPALLDGMTTLSMFRGAGNLCLDLIERPNEVRRVAAHLDRLGMAAHRAFFRTLTELGHAQTVTWAGIYAPGKCEMVQCDFAVNISPAMFEEFVLPRLREQTEYFDYSSYHMDGVEQCRFLDLLCTLPGLQSIQWNPGMLDRNPLVWMDFFRQARAKGRALWIPCSGTDQAVELTRRLGPDGLLLAVEGPKTLDEVESLLGKLKRAVRR